MKVILVGYMGSGKSTVGKQLAKELQLSFVDLDGYIEEAEEKTITQLFDEDGQIRFRIKEHQHLNTLLEERDNLVLATGGGAPCYSGNMETILKASPNVFYLRLSISELVERLYPEKANRPLIAHLTHEEMPEFFGKHLFERNVYYSLAPHTIFCDGKSTVDIVKEIRALLV